jgi:lipopolysaccharide transport system permease protein
LSSDETKPARQVFRGGHQLAHPWIFLHDAWRDLRFCHEVARRTFLEALARRYRHSALGVIWALLPSLMIVLLFSLGQRAQLTGLGVAAVPPQIQAVLGIVMFQCFQEGFQSQRLLFARHASLIARQRVPLEGLVLAALIEAGFAFAVRVPVLIFTFLHYAVMPAASAGWAVFGIVGLIVLGSAFGLLAAPWSALSRDIDSLMAVVPWIVILTTPVFLATAPVAILQQAYQFNPLAHVFDAVRAWSFGTGGVSLIGWALPLLAWPLLCVAWLLLRVSAPHVIERSLM